MTARSSMAAAEPVSWRDGVHITGTAIWCDARRARDVCFVSAPHAIRDPRHGQLIGTPAALTLLERSGRGGAVAAASQLAVPCGHPFTLGVRRLELFRSGHGVGGASLAVQVDDRRVVYAGAVDPRGTGLGGAADVRAADVLVVRAPYGDERFAFRPAAEVAAEVAAHARTVAERGGALVVLVSSASKGLDVAAQLAALDPELPLAAHRAIHHAAQKLRAQVTLPRIRRWSQKGRAGDVLLWPLRFRDKIAPPALPPQSSVALVSGAAADPAAIDAACADIGFSWSDQADAAGLRAYADATGAAAVYLLDGGTDAFLESLASGGRRVVRLAAPQQMRLFRSRVA